ncbi:ComF family protein [Nitratifractor sp.]|uniref:ComF family protein n=1 Tax=Nitratifractor sp. TaxID=2268144 RepID=UPI0025E63745|nr:ComF family protein [Nitratifractor sp.]
MRCLSCRKWSLQVICRSCHEQLLIPTVSTRKVGSLDVVSLFRYRNIEPFLLSKHTPAGYRLFRYFGRRHIAPFLEAFAEGLEAPARIIAVDERPRGGYSHTALLARYGAVSGLTPLHGVLPAANQVHYVGRSLQFRLENPRDFHYNGPSGIDAVLLDDIITTGSTLGEAHRVLRENGVNVLFALTLADAR